MNEQKNIIRRQFDRYIAGELSHEEIEKLWADLIDHPELLDELKVQASLKSAFDQNQADSARENTVDYTSSASIVKWVVPIAAVVIIAIGFSWFQFSGSPDKPVAIESISHAELYSPDVQRSEEGERLRGVDSLMHAGYTSAVNSEIQPAITYFQQVADSDLDNDSPAKAKHNLGIIFYNDRDFEQAVQTFKEAIEYESDRSFLAKTHWYLANTYIQLEHYDAAYEHAQLTLEKGSDFEHEARDLIQALEPFALTEAH